MVEQVSEMARESFGFLQVKIMISANDSNGSVTIAKQAMKVEIAHGHN